MPTAPPEAVAENVEDGSPSAAGTARPPFAGRALPLLIFFLVLIAAAIWTSLGDTGTGSAEDWLQALGIAAAVGITETTALHFEFRRQAFSMSLSEAPVVVGLFFVAPLPLLAARLVGAGASFIIRRTRLVVVAFNLPLFAVEIGVAVSVFRAFGSISDHTSEAIAHGWPLSWLAAFSSVLAYDMVSAIGVLAAIFATQARLRRSEVAQLVPAVAMSAVFGTTIGLLVVVVLRAQAAAAVLLALLAAVVVLGFRAYGQLSRRHATLSEVHEFTQQVAEAPDGRELADVLLRNAARLLNAEAAALRLLDPGPGGAPGVLRLGADGRTEAVPAQQATLRADDGVRPSVLFGAQSVLLPRNTSDPVRRRWLTAECVRDALLVPLPGTSGVLGCLEVTDRLGEVATFTDNDLQLAETLAAAVAVALENTRLVEKSLHDATHDSLTGLPNRSFFLRRTEIAMADTTGDPANAAVLMVDLDRFKEVNDTLGHLSGDRVLAGVADLLRSHAPSAATVARLGGDEFGVLLPEPGDVAAVVDLAVGLQRALQRPLELEGLSLEVTGSVGVAVSPYDGTDAATLLQRADAAMFAAKREDPGSVRTWDASMDTASPRRLALVGELRRALERGELRVHYQPKVAVATRDVVGMEALVRWQHPSWGLLPPDEFVPVAETTGLIVPLTSVVLRTALEDCRRLLDDGAYLSVAVNLSVRGLLDPELHSTVRGLLDSIGVPPELLTLEITESHVMSDVARVLPLLESLHELGVKLSVDDFGTGYSSLAYLRRLPVDEIKIDKSFVLGLAGEAADSSASAIVETIVGLGETLGLSVVAEGVEDEQSWSRLEEVGCDVAQGYLIGRPMPAPQVARWLATWRQRTGGSAGPVSLPGRPL